MKHYLTGSQDLSQTLLKECFKVTVPEPLDYKVNYKIAFSSIPHLLNPSKYGWMIEFPESTHRRVHWVSRLAIRLQGSHENLTSNDHKALKELFEGFDLSSYTNDKGEQPYNDLEDIIDSLVNYWERFKSLYQTQEERDRIVEIVKNKDLIALDNLIPSWAEPISSGEVFLQKWKPVSINSLSSEDLFSKRFPKIKEKFAKSIVLERENNDIYRGYSEFLNRNDNLDLDALEEIQDARGEGSLVFPEN